MTVHEAPSAVQDRLRRARVAMPLAMVSFAVPYVAMLFTVQWLQPAGQEGFADLAYFVGLLLLGAVLVAVVIPIVVFSLGRVLDAAMLAWGTTRAALAFGGAGLALGLVLAALMSWAQDVSMVGATANVALPAAIGGLGTRLLLPVALAHRWVVVLAWVLAALPVAGVVAVVLSVRFT
ncbi:MAG TPA: hypothetical protein VFD20_00945 [Demequina sp.]|nr:hypothetical protein [Demequina sp.]